MKQTTELKNYTIGFDSENAHAAFAAGVLKEELDKRTGLDFAFAPAGAGAIELSLSQTLAPAPEGYYYEAKDGCVAIAGYDRLGILHGIGHLLREANWYDGGIAVADETLSTHPKQKLRGSQLHFRGQDL